MTSTFVDSLLIIRGKKDNVTLSSSDKIYFLHFEHLLKLKLASITHYIQVPFRLCVCLFLDHCASFFTGLVPAA